MNISKQISELEDEAYIAFHKWKDDGDMDAKARYEAIMKKISDLELSSINEDKQ